MLTPRLNSDGSLLIQSLIPDGDRALGDISITLMRGEVFGGKSFEQWRNVALDGGFVFADELDV